MFRRLFFLILYYGIFQILPDGYDHEAFDFCNGLRTWACKRLFEHCGKHVNVHRRAKFGLGNKIRVGDYSNLGVNVYINGRGGVTIGSHVLMGPDVIIYSGTHTFEYIDVPIQWQPMEYKSVCIEDGVWIGARTIVLPGVTIGKGSIIGANSTVTTDVPPNVVAAGSPARVVKPRPENSSR